MTRTNQKTRDSWEMEQNERLLDVLGGVTLDMITDTPWEKTDTLLDPKAALNIKNYIISRDLSVDPNAKPEAPKQPWYKRILNWLGL